MRSAPAIVSGTRKTKPAISPRQSALAKGEKRYFGKVCAKHPELGGERRTGDKDCAACNTERRRRCHAKHREQERERDRERYAKNRERKREYNREWRAKNRERARKYNRERYAQTREQQREYARERYAQIKERRREYAREWYAKNREYVLLQKRLRGLALKGMVNGLSVVA